MHPRLQSSLMLLYGRFALMPREIGAEYRFRSCLLAQPRPKINPAARLDADGQMGGIRGLKLGLMDFAAREIQDIARAHCTFPHNVRRNGIAVTMPAHRRRIGNAEASPSLASIDLHDDHVVVVPVRLECLATSEADVGIDPHAMREASLDGIRQAGELGNVLVDVIDDEADSLR